MTYAWDNTSHDPLSLADRATAIQFDNELEIDRLRLTAAAALIQALTHLDIARRAIQELHSDHIYDVELVEHHTGPDLTAFIADSLRNTRAAYAIIRRVEEHT